MTNVYSVEVTARQVKVGDVIHLIEFLRAPSWQALRVVRVIWEHPIEGNEVVTLELKRRNSSDSEKPLTRTYPAAQLLIKEEMA